MGEEISSTLLMFVLNIISDKRKLVCSWKAFKKSFVDPQYREGNSQGGVQCLSKIIEMSQFFILRFRIIPRPLKNSLR